MSLLQLSRKVPPGLTLIGSLLSNWKLVSLPLILSGAFKANFWQAVLIFLATLPISIAVLVCLRNRRHAKRQKELGAELPPSIPSKSFGGLDVLKGLRWEYYFGYIGDSYFRFKGLCRSMNIKAFSGEILSNWGEQLGHTMSVAIFWEPRVRGRMLPYFTYFAEELVDLHLGARVYQGEGESRLSLLTSNRQLSRGFSRQTLNTLKKVRCSGVT